MENVTTQEAKLREEILGDARAKAERALARAKNEADAMRRKCRGEIAARRKSRLAEVRDAAREEAGGILRDVERQLRAKWLQRREDVLEESFRKAVAECAGLAGEERERSYAALVEEALRAIGPADALKVRFPADCASFLTAGWLRGIAARVFGDAASTVEFSLEDGGEPGVVVSSPDGRMVFDNTYGARLKYLKAELRRLVL